MRRPPSSLLVGGREHWEGFSVPGKDAVAGRRKPKFLSVIAYLKLLWPQL